MADAGEPRRGLKILIVAPAWVGDMVMSHCLVRVLLARFPGVEIHMLAPPATAPLTQRMPGVAATHVLDAGHGELGLRKRRAAARELAHVGFAQAIVLPNSFKSALVPLLAGIPKRTGWTGEHRYGLLNDRRRLVKDHYPLMIERFMALALDAGVLLDKPFPLPQLSADPANAARLRAEHALQPDGAVALCPGAEFGPAKRWPVAHFAELARELTSRDRQVWLLGGRGDVSACAKIEEQVPKGVVNLAGRTTLTDALDVLSLAQAVVANDSGLMHVACALERRVVALYGSTSPAFTPPLGDRAAVLSAELPCSPCFERTCPLGHLDCLRLLTPARVLATLANAA